MMKSTVPSEIRFWRFVEKTETCWLWTGGRIGKSKQYGSFGVGKTWLAHRWIWTQLNGQIPIHHEIDHRCGVGHCVRPDHLELVTQKENRQRGRHHGFTMQTNGSGYRGVYRHPINPKWIAQIRSMGTTRYLGSFDTAEEAAIVYNGAALEAFGSSFHNFNLVQMG